MDSHIVRLAETYVTGLLRAGLTADHVYHDLAHTLSARDASHAIGQRYRINHEELELLTLAALFHDTGFTRTYNGHEDASKEIAAAFLKEHHYSEENTQQVLDLIEVTKAGVEPHTLLQQILKDADFNTLNSGYIEKSKALRHEWKVFNGVEMSEEQWLENKLQFWASHQFYTGEALAMFGEDKRTIFKKLKKDVDKAPVKDKKRERGTEHVDFAINSSKSAQMMFKTTLRNQIDLTNIADNKANIMLTINSALITFGMPLMAAQLDTFPRLIYPGGVLLLTSLLSIVFATLATRPVSMEGQTSIDTIKKGNTNLFFFGNFFRMSLDDYRTGLRKVVQDDQILDNSIVNDLYFLGTALGHKYRRLRLCYGIFMVGMTLTVITFALSFVLSR